MALDNQTFANLERDISDTGEAINECKMITPRYGLRFKSIPLISKEADVKVSELSSAIDTALAGGAGAAGWTANLIEYKGSTQNKFNEDQEKINNETIQYALNISELRQLKPRKNGSIAMTLGYSETGIGAGVYLFDKNIVNNDDAGEYIRVNGIQGAWVLQPKNEISLELFGAVGDKVIDDAAAMRKCSLFAEKYNLKIKGESKVGYYFASDVTIYNDFDVEGLYFNASESKYGSLYIKTKKEPEIIALSSLGGLTEGSSKITGFPLSAVGKYVRFSTETAVLTERNNNGL
ncbi:hypothetical protein C9E89_022750, partial [Acinetobacter sichuanensis]